MSWAELPSEISLYVIRYLDREDLKQLRLVSKTDAQSATPQLFKTVHLSPNTQSFDRARALAATRRLSCHVQNVVYHTGRFVGRDYKDFEWFVDWPNRYKRKGTKEEWSTEVARSLHKCYIEEIDSHKEFETWDEEKELKELCRRFTSLNSIAAVPDPEYWNAPPGFIERRTGVDPDAFDDACGRHFANLLGAVAGVPLTEIDASSMSWADMPKISQKLLPTLNLKNLDRLILGLNNEEFAGIRNPSHVDAFDALLGASVTSHEYTLELDCKLLAFGAIREETQKISQALFKHHWPRLKKLTLYGICTMEEDLQEFLGKHSTTLRCLRLGNIQLLTRPILNKEEDAEEKGCDSVGSVVGLFQWIHQNLSLELAAISEGWTNCQDETWSVPDSPHRGGIRRDIELWLAHQGPCPIPSELLGDSDGERLREGVAEKWSDESWEWDESIQYYDPWL